LIGLSTAHADELFYNPDGSGFAAFSDQEYFNYSPAGETSENDLLKVTSDAMTGFLMMKSVTLTDHSLQELKYVTSGGAILDMPLNDLAKGVILMASGKREVLKLVGYDLKPDTGGNIDLVYLSDGIWNSYKVFPMALMNSNGNWMFQTREANKAGTNINSMYLKRKTLFGQVIGIESVTINP
jgi:hypothetical protein